MSATPNADLALRTIEGAREAHRLVAELRQGHAHPDALLVRVRMWFTMDDEVRTRAAMRELSKMLEFQG